MWCTSVSRYGIRCNISSYTIHRTKFISKICKVYFFIPTVLWAILWIFPIMLHSELTGFNMEIIIKQFTVLCFALLPAVILYVNQEINLFMKNEFVTTSKILGASRFRIIRKHIWLYLKEILVVLFTAVCSIIYVINSFSVFGILIGDEV